MQVQRCEIFQIVSRMIKRTFWGFPKILLLSPFGKCVSFMLICWRGYQDVFWNTCLLSFIVFFWFWFFWFLVPSKASFLQKPATYDLTSMTLQLQIWVGKKSLRPVSFHFWMRKPINCLHWLVTHELHVTSESLFVFSLNVFKCSPFHLSPFPPFPF